MKITLYKHPILSSTHGNLKISNLYILVLIVIVITAITINTIYIIMNGMGNTVFSYSPTSRFKPRIQLITSEIKRKSSKPLGTLVNKSLDICFKVNS